MNRRTVGSIAASVFALLAAGTEASKGWRDQQERWWTRPKIESEVVVALLVARQLSEGHADDERLQRINAALEHSLLLFDDDNSDASLQELVSLSYFNLDGAPGEIYSCVVTRKGRIAIPQIKSALEEGKDRCVRDLGKQSPICANSARQGIARDRFESLIARIESDTPCSIEK